MVVFTCGHCGESVQKPKVEKHYLTKCRNMKPNLSCMDCFKDFLGNDYEEHTKCITEEQRYSGKGFVAKEKKGEKKQTAWVEMVSSVLEEQKTAPKNVLRIIETISKHNNTPRKKPKFINFVKNVCGHKTNPKDIDQAWDMISVKLSALSLANSNPNLKTEAVNGESEDKSLNDTATDDKPEVNGCNEPCVQEDDNNINKTENGKEKKLSKKQRKEEKKRKKYEAELQSAAAPIEEEVVPVNVTKKDKKKKSKSESENVDAGDNEKGDSKSNKNKKRKRVDTVNEPQDTPAIENIENEPLNKEKTQKKKKKVGQVDDASESICLHDQNVAKSEEVVPSANFNWHSVIISVLEKKDNELPFKRLQKKVLSEYSEATGMEIDDRIADKFIKKLKSAPNVRVDKNRVMLIQ